MTEGRRFGGSPTQADVLREVIEDRLRAVHTALPAEVVEWDATTQTVSARPTVWGATPDQDGRYVDEPLPTIFDVPVMFPRSGGGYITFPIAAGDTVLLVFAERSIGQWRYTGRDGSPGDQRTHTLSGAVAIPGLFPRSGALPSSAIVAGSVVIVGTTEVRLGAPTASDFVALSSKVDTEIGKLWTALGAHTHPYLPGPGPATVPTSPPVVVNTSAPTAATKVKAV